MGRSLRAKHQEEQGNSDDAGEDDPSSPFRPSVATIVVAIAGSVAGGSPAKSERRAIGGRHDETCAERIGEMQSVVMREIERNRESGDETRRDEPSWGCCEL